MKTKKSTAFWASFFAILAVYFITLWVSPETAATLGSGVVVSLALAGGFYSAANVADNGVKGAFYKAELDGK